jgi:FG-GAP-like repeat
MKTLIALVGSILLGILVSGAASGAAGKGFVGPVDYATAGSPSSVWTSDLNGDGKRDVLTFDSRDEVSVLLGDGQGGFGRKHSYDTGSGDVADPADLNGDDKLDLVTASFDEDEIAVQLNRGNGSFQHRHAYSIRQRGLSWFDIGDVNGDGDRDIVTIQGTDENTDENDDEDDTSHDENGSGTVSVLINDGNGSFKPGRDYDLAQDPDECILGDLNHDGRPDLVVTNTYEDSITVILNHNGGYDAGRDYAVVVTNGIQMHDVNGDGRPDLVAVEDYYSDDVENGGISVLLNRGDGTFRPAQEYETGESPVALAISDLNGDDAADIVTANEFTSDVSVFLNDGDGGFGSKREFETVEDPAFVAVADLTGDASPDLVTFSGDGGDTISLLVNNGDGGFRSGRDLETGRDPADVAINDLNGDGRRDLVVADGGQLAVSVLLNTMGEGRPVVAPRRVFPHAQEYESGLATSVAASDLNADGRQDLVVTNRHERTVSVLLAGKNGFGDPQDYDVGRSPRWAAVGDLDGDGAPDIAAVNERDDTVSILINKGHGTFKAKHDLPTGHRPFVIGIADLNGDGKQDIATGDAGPVNGLTVSVFLNSGDGTFATRRAYRVPRAPISLAIGDVNGDGHPDLVTGDHLRLSVSVLLNAGDGTFPNRRQYRVGRFPSSVAIGDLNGDKAPDLAVSDYRDSKLSVLLNAGDGTFGEKRDYAAGSDPFSVVIADFDGDGAADLATGDPEAEAIRVFPGKGDGSFGNFVEYPVPGGPGVLVASDLDGDGNPDLVAGLGSSVAVHLNRTVG